MPEARKPPRKRTRSRRKPEAKPDGPTRRRKPVAKRRGKNRSAPKTTAGSSSECESKPYEVGYKKPPVRTRFKKGKSGNPKGRPKGARNMSTILEAALTERVSVRKKGKQKRIALIDAIAISLANKGAGGDLRAIRLLFDAAHKFGLFAEEQGTPEQNSQKLNEEEELVFSEIQRLISADPSASNEDISSET